jgi:pyrroline-5-carboxylate reductase
MAAGGEAKLEMGKEYFVSLCQLANLQPKIAFVGGGNMAQALSKGFLKTGLLEKNAIAASDPVPAMRDYLEQKLEIKAYLNNRDLLDHNQSGIVILAVKPQHLDPVLDELAEHYRSSSSKFGLLVSIVAGASIQRIQAKFADQSIPIVRVMPNTPALIGCGASVYSKNSSCTSAHGEVIKALMETVGICYEAPETHIDAVTGLAASGPAFIYTVIDALSDGGVKMGLPRDLSTELAAQMVMGSAKMVLETRKHPGELKNQVCSPGGTTIAGVHVLEERGVRAAFIAAVEAATKRAKELS